MIYFALGGKYFAIVHKRTLRDSDLVQGLLVYCCAASEGSEQQHNQDLREIYKVTRILEFITFLPECIAFNQSTLRYFLAECIAPRTARK